MTAIIHPDLRVAIESLGQVLSQCPMQACFRTVTDDYLNFYRGFSANEKGHPVKTANQDSFVRETGDLRNRIDDSAKSGQMGYWSRQWAPTKVKEPVADSAAPSSSPKKAGAGRRLFSMANFFRKKDECDPVLAVAKNTPAGMALREPAAGFGVILSPPAKDFVGRRLHYMVNFFMNKGDLDTVLAVVKNRPEALFHIVAPSLVEGEVPPLLKGNPSWMGDHAAKFATLYVDSMTKGNPPKSCCVPYELTSERPSGQLLNLG